MATIFLGDIISWDHHCVCYHWLKCYCIAHEYNFLLSPSVITEGRWSPLNKLSWNLKRIPSLLKQVLPSCYPKHKADAVCIVKLFNTNISCVEGELRWGSRKLIAEASPLGRPSHRASKEISVLVLFLLGRTAQSLRWLTCIVVTVKLDCVNLIGLETHRRWVEHPSGCVWVDHRGVTFWSISGSSSLASFPCSFPQLPWTNQLCSTMPFFCDVPPLQLVDRNWNLWNCEPN